MFIGSFFVYLISYSISVLISYFSENNKCNKVVKLMLMLTIPLVPSLIAALRIDVGTDYQGYVAIYNRLKEVNIVDYFTQNTGIEFGFYLINRFCYLLFRTERAVWFIATYMYVLLIYLGLRNISKDNNNKVYIGLAIFYIAYFNAGLNILRQVLSLSLCFYSFSFIVQKEKVKAFIIMSTALLFHQTALLCFLVFLISPLTNAKINIIKKFVLITFSIFFIFCMPKLLQYGNQITYLSKYYTFYQIDYNAKPGFGFLIYLLPVIMLYFVMFKKIVNLNKIYEFYLILLFLWIPIRTLAYYLVWLDRLSYCFSIAEVSLGMILISNSKGKNKSMICLYLICWYLLYHIGFYMTGIHGTYPYQNILFS